MKNAGKLSTAKLGFFLMVKVLQYNFFSKIMLMQMYEISRYADNFV